MPKASIKLPDGTSVVIDGSPEEVAKLLALYGGAASKEGARSPNPPKQPKKESSSGKREKLAKNNSAANNVDLASIIEKIKNCDEAENIEIEILDKTGQVNRILLPLFIVHKYMDNEFSMTSGEVSQITTDLGIPVQQPNVSRTLSGTASKYVIGDKVRKKGQAVRYKLSRRGVQYFNKVLNGEADDK